MLNFLSSLLSPIFTPMGVSQADLNAYLNQLSGYVYAILFILIAMILLLIFAGKISKKNSGIIRLASVLGALAGIVCIVNAICFGPMYNNVSGFLNASKVELSDETVAQSRATVQKVGEEGVVLLKNNGILPLNVEETKKLNVFGWSSTNPIYGGTGSGSSSSATAVSILQSLKDAGFEPNEGLSGMYVEYRAERPTIAMASQDWTVPEPPVSVYNDNMMNAIHEYSDTAVIVIGRSGGEGADLPTDMKAVLDGTYNPAANVSVAPGNYGYMNAVAWNNGAYDDFEAGESYLELSVTEENLVKMVCSEFDKVIVIINANNTMELGWVDEYPQIGAVLLVPGAGVTGFAALGEIMSGAVNPSGRTADTFVKDLFDTPYINNIGEMSFTNVDDLKAQIAANDGAFEGTLAFVNYVEGIYVGYKYYETASDEGAIKYEDKVQYPFGYGLSYTTFDQKIQNFKVDGGTVIFDVVVTNTGNVAGKDVVEVYFTPPYTNGGIEKASVNLIDFAKTEVIEPGASETISFAFPLEDMAAYDSEEIKVKGGGYILEAGDYTISLRADSHTVLAEEKFNVAADIDYSQTKRESDNTAAVNQFNDYARGSFEVLSRKDKFANYGTTCGRKLEADDFIMDDATRAKIEEYAFGFYDSTKYNDPADEMPTTGAKNGLKLADMTGLAYDDPKWDQLLDQLTFEDMATMINVGGWQTAPIESVGKVGTSDCDGPAGLSNFITGAYGTAYPAETLMAMTWNMGLAEEIGTSMGQEYQDANNYGWYGPAMNTHRSAFAGRNFEYYSEDGVLAGVIAAREINGASTKGVYPYIKHYAMNDQETNRCSFLLTYAPEQAFREIYLKPFEIAVKKYQGQALAAMSAFNWIGTEPGCANNELLNTVLRDEWGFRGMVETDY
ncbi:MAG: glycoside hydrolase family 3 C-terminal domain-containing protein, partial [Firmicutes bacterium]|nr:glycoside hydrolase family 3 C-terminal domain-containing protein [Bacillota bacterium]